LHTLAHLSDPHLTSLVGVEARALFNKRILGYLSWRRRRRWVHRAEVLGAVTADILAHDPDQILLSGDLTHVGLPQECRAAACWLEALAVPDRLLLVPGNHDRYVAAPWSQTLGHWAAYLEPPGGQWPRVWSKDDLCVLGLDCAVPSPWFMATGTLGIAQLDAVAGQLQAARARGQFRLVMLHHSPLPRGHAWRKRLTDAHALVAIIERVGAELIVHGHGHQEGSAEIPWRDGICHVLAAPSASYAAPGRAGWNLIRIERAHGAGDHWRLSVERRRWRAGVMATLDRRDLSLSAI
jgi:3',5'-cyclic AMP phosphodiesterase CpdA